MHGLRQWTLTRQASNNVLLGAVVHPRREASAMPLEEPLRCCRTGCSCRARFQLVRSRSVEGSHRCWRAITPSMAAHLPGLRRCMLALHQRNAVKPDSKFSRCKPSASRQQQAFHLRSPYETKSSSPGATDDVAVNSMTHPSEGEAGGKASICARHKSCRRTQQVLIKSSMMLCTHDMQVCSPSLSKMVSSCHYVTLPRCHHTTFLVRSRRRDSACRPGAPALDAHSASSAAEPNVP